jgi:hypothetical protein
VLYSYKYLPPFILMIRLKEKRNRMSAKRPEIPSSVARSAKKCLTYGDYQCSPHFDAFHRPS